MEEVRQETRKALKEIDPNIKYLESFSEIGQKISAQWEQGLLTSLLILFPNRPCLCAPQGGRNLTLKPPVRDLGGVLRWLIVRH